MRLPLLTLVAVSSLLAMASTDAQTMAMPDAFRVLTPPLRPWATHWVEAEDAESNVGIQAHEKAYGGKHRFLFAADPPGPEGYFVRFPVDVPTDRAGRFRLFAACGPVGEAFVSPVSLIVDGRPLRRIARAPAGGPGWGVSNIIHWVDLGDVELAPGRHTLELNVRDPRAMDKRFAQGFDVMALVHERDTLFPATFALSSPAGGHTVDAGQSLRASLRLKVLTTGVREPADTVAIVRLLRHGAALTEVPVPLRVEPGSAGREIPIKAEVPVPFDVAHGRCELVVSGLVGQDGQPALLPAGHVEVRGRFPSPGARPVGVGPPQIQGEAAAQAGASWRFRVAVESLADVADPPRRLVVRLELAPHLCYLAQAFDLKPAPQGWRKGERVLLGPFSLPLPADLPRGTYTAR